MESSRMTRECSFQCLQPEIIIYLKDTEFRNFNHLKKVYGSAGLVGDDRVVSNIMEN